MQDTTANIKLYTGQSPNGVKISITLEELGLAYEVRKVDMTINEQKSDWFSEINPNGRIPAITDTFTDGSEIRIFESGSIMQYLVARYDKDFRISYPPGTREHVEVRSAHCKCLTASDASVDDELALLSKLWSWADGIRWVRCSNRKSTNTSLARASEPRELFKCNTMHDRLTFAQVRSVRSGAQ